MEASGPGEEEVRTLLGEYQSICQASMYVRSRAGCRARGCSGAGAGGTYHGGARGATGRSAATTQGGRGGSTVGLPATHFTNNTAAPHSALLPLPHCHPVAPAKAPSSTTFFGVGEHRGAGGDVLKHLAPLTDSFDRVLRVCVCVKAITILCGCWKTTGRQSTPSTAA